MESILEGIDRFQKSVFPNRREAFEALGGGQQPKILLVTCSASRIDPSMVTQTDPGEIFVVRNAGNLVAPHSPRRRRAFDARQHFVGPDRRSQRPTPSRRACCSLRSAPSRRPRDN